MFSGQVAARTSTCFAARTSAKYGAVRRMSFRVNGTAYRTAHTTFKSGVGSKFSPWGMNSNHAFSNMREEDMADHSWRQTNHIWTDEEIKLRMKTSSIKHAPETLSDTIMHTIVKYILYKGFNFITGYNETNPTTKSIEWRLIVLESFAGVPGFVAAGFRHFRSLRMLERDRGFIFTLLEEAENERMHLLVCMKMFDAGPVTKALVIGAQLSMTPFLMLVYMIKPSALHRFVGYLEETAVHTYSNIVKNCETPGTHLNTSWAELPAPPIAISYWQMKSDATWTDTLKRMLADESHHRDINHTYASMPSNIDNPFAEEHMRDFDTAVHRRTERVLMQYLKDNSGALDLKKNSANGPLA